MAGFLNTAFLSAEAGGSSNVLLTPSDDSIKELENLTRIEIDKIAGANVNFSKYYVKGLIWTAYPSFETKIRKTKKLVLKSYKLQQPSSPEYVPSVSVYIIGENVTKCDILKSNDVVIIKGFSFEKPVATGQDIQILVDLQNADAKIWMIKQKKIPASQNKAVSSSRTFYSDKTNLNPRCGKNIAWKNKLQSSDILPVSSGSTCKPEISNGKEEVSSLSNEQLKVLVAGGKKLRILQQPTKLHYTKLADLRVNRNEHKVVNFFAIVKYFKSPQKSKGNDYCMVISVVDDSLTSADESLVCTIFSHSKEQLPAIKCFGDIVKFEGVSISKFKDAVHGSAKNFQWLVFDGYPDTSIIPTASSTANYTLEEQDKITIQNLRTWALLHDRLPPRRTISQILSEELYFNISCQVVSVCEVINGNCLVLTVWDGTFPQHDSTSLEERKTSTLVVSNALKKVSERFTIDIHLYDDHSQSILTPGDYVTLVNVHAIPRKSQVGGTDKISFIVHKGAVNGRGIHKMSLDSREVKEVQNQIASSEGNRCKTHMTTEPGDRRDNKTNTIPRTLQTSCTITDLPCIPFTSIDALKNCSKIPNKFRSRVKAVAFLPNDVKDFVRRCCSNCKTLVQINSSTQNNSEAERAHLLEKHSKKEAENGKETTVVDKHKEVNASRYSCKADFKSSEVGTGDRCKDFIIEETSPKCSVCQQEMHSVYVLSLIIEDPTDILHVMLFDSDVTNFLIDLPTPEEFVSSPEAQQTVRDSLVSITDNQTNKLTAESQPDGSRPWMECCIMSYKIDDVVFYRMFGTTLI